MVGDGKLRPAMKSLFGMKSNTMVDGKVNRTFSREVVWLMMQFGTCAVEYGTTGLACHLGSKPHLELQPWFR